MGSGFDYLRWSRYFPWAMSDLRQVSIEELVPRPHSSVGQSTRLITGWS